MYDGNVGTVRQLRVYPVKGLGPIAVDSARVLDSGALEFDRRWALVDSRERFINGKNYAAIHRIRAGFDLGRLEITVEGNTWSLAKDAGAIGAWFTERLGERVELRENELTGFPDDTVSPGPTVVTEASINAVAGWFGFDSDAIRLRFRANIELSGLPAFWEDHLYGSEFRIGGVRLLAVNPCARCIVPSRDALTGEATAEFQKRFMALRRQHLPEGAKAAYFDHYYRFTVNTRLAGEPGLIQTGDLIAEA